MLTSALVVTGALCIAACAASGGRDRPTVGGTPASPPEPTATTPATTTTRDGWREGERVMVRGRISQTPWQHMITSVEGKRAEYFDLEGGGQTVIYARDLPPCAGTLEIEATVLRVAGPGKRPGRDTRADEYVELQLDVGAARCLD